MRQLTIIATMVLGALAALAVPSSALAISDCTYASDEGNGGLQDVSTSAVLGPGKAVTVYADTTVDGDGGGRTGSANAAGVCADTNTAPVDGGYVEGGAGEDPATGDADPGAISNQPDAYAVADGSDANMDPADAYMGASNYETGATRTSSSQCTSSGPDNGAPGSSNSGGCVGVDNGPWVYVGDDLPTPVCGHTQPDWANTSRDGCSLP